MAKTSLVLGGTRSGKTAYALTLAKPPRTYVATATPGDEEMRTRIDAHQAERGADWRLIEAQTDLAVLQNCFDDVLGVSDQLTVKSVRAEIEHLAILAVTVKVPMRDQSGLILHAFLMHARLDLLFGPFVIPDREFDKMVIAFIN